MRMRIEIIMLRHAATKGNTEKRYIGITDEPILESEEAGLKNLSGHLGNIDMVFVSPMLRCRMTADCVFPGAEQLIIPSFREMDFGRFENKNYQELSGDPAYQKWIDSGGTMAIPGGESMETFRQRTLEGFDEMMEICRNNGYKRMAVVAHGGTIMSILSSYARPSGGYYDFQVGPREGYVVVLDPLKYHEDGMRILRDIRENSE
jgi:alpha-ribazole phosphatase